MRIQLQSLKHGPNRVSLRSPPENLNLPGEIFANDVIVEGILEGYGDTVNADFHIFTDINLICDRCAMEFTSSLNLDARIYFTASRAMVRDEDNVKFYNPDKPEVDISGNVHDELLLAMPLKILCREDCKGLCPHCGADLNYETCGCEIIIPDHRWQALQAVKESLAGKD